jgi:PAS domain S-box-containing protein
MKKTSGDSGMSVQTNTLHKRVKELRCLCDIGSVTHAPNFTLRETIHEIARLLPGGFRRPEAVWVRVTFNGEEHTRGDYRLSERKISSEIIVRGEIAGAVEVGYVAGTPEYEAGYFPREERLLLDAVAERLGAIIASRQAEEALRFSEEKFSKAFHATPNVVTISTLEEERLIDANRSFYLWTGYTPDEVIGRPVTEVGIWETKEHRRRTVERLKKDGRVRNMPIKWRSKAGEPRVGRMSAEIINIGGTPCVIAIITDITRQKESRELLQTVFQNSPFGIFVLQDGVLTHTNPQFQKITGYEHAELRGRELLSIVAAEDTDVVASSILLNLQDKSPYPCEYRLLSKTGQIKWVVQTVSRIHYSGSNAVLGNIMDISELKYLERKIVEYEELSKMKSDLLATVSHELRTPLATIKGYATMMLDYFSRLDAGETRDYLRAIDGSTDRLSKLVDNLLDTSRLEAGLLRLQRSTTGISPLIRKLVQEAGVRNTRHTITARLDGRLPPVEIDTKRVCQVLDNLIDNAVKYSPPGTKITVSAQTDGAGLLLAVADEGPGIAPEELENIFDRMYRIEKRLDSRADGIGLGLYICRRLVEAHGGTIWAESYPGQGTIIKFTLPPAAKVGQNGWLAGSRR